METRFLIALVCAASLAAGCMSKPSLDVGSVAQSIRNPFSRPAVAENASKLMQAAGDGVDASSLAASEYGRLAAQLRSDDAKTRVEACEQLGRISTTGNGIEALDLLTELMQGDPDPEVRSAATNALLGMEDPRASRSLDAFAVQPESSVEPVKKISLLKKLWR